MPVGAAAVFGTSFEVILPMTDTLTMTAAQANTNLVNGTSGLSGGKTLTLPAIAQMVAAQNPFIQVTNNSDSGGTITVAAASGEAVKGVVSVAVATGYRYYHDGLKTWFQG